MAAHENAQPESIPGKGIYSLSRTCFHSLTHYLSTCSHVSSSWPFPLSCTSNVSVTLNVVRIDGVSMSPHSRNDDIMQANVYSWHILNPSVRSQTESHPLPSSSSSSLATDISPTGAMGSPYTPSSRRNNYIAGKANDTNPFTASTNYSPPYCSRKEGADATNHLTLKGEGGGKVQRVPVIYEAIQGIPSTKYTLDDILPSINIMVDPERRNSIPLSEQCEIVHVLEDLALSLDFHQELTRINHQILNCERIFLFGL